MYYSEEFFKFHYCLSLFLTSGTSLALGLFILIKNPRSTVNRMFAIFMLFVALWSFTQALIGTYPDPSFWLPIAQFEHAGHVFIPSTFLHFVHALIGRGWTRRVKLSYVVSLLFALTVPTKLFFRDVDTTEFVKFVVEPGPLYLPYMAWFIWTVLEALGNLWMAIPQKSRYSPEEGKKLKLIFWATLIGYTGGLPNFFYVFDLNVYPITPFSTYLVPVYPIMIAYAIIRHQALDIRVAIRKSIVYSVLVAIMTAVYFTFVLVAEKVLQGVIGYRSLIGTIVAGFVIALGFTPLRDFVQRFIDQCFFKGGQVALAEQNERLLVEVRRSEQMKAVATLAAGLAHEIKNPLTAIKTFTESMQTKGTDPAFREKFQQIVGGEVERINSIVQQLLEFAKPVPPKLQPVQVPTLIDETLAFLTNDLLAHHIDVQRHYDGHGQILGDPQQLKQVFLNLFLNSLQAMDGNGRLEVRTQQQGSDLEVIVSDTGQGIPPEHLPHIFEPFYTTKAAGTGLGLAVVQGIIKEHRGRISVESWQGQGTRFSLLLPLAT